MQNILRTNENNGRKYKINRLELFYNRWQLKETEEKKMKIKSEVKRKVYLTYIEEFRLFFTY